MTDWSGLPGQTSWTGLLDSGDPLEEEGGGGRRRLEVSLFLSLSLSPSLSLFLEYFSFGDYPVAIHRLLLWRPLISVAISTVVCFLRDHPDGDYPVAIFMVHLLE